MFSALPLKADIAQQTRHVRFVPITRPFEMSKFRSTNHSSFWIVRFSQAIHPPAEIFRAVKRAQILLQKSVETGQEA